MINKMLEEKSLTGLLLEEMSLTGLLDAAIKKATEMQESQGELRVVDADPRFAALVMAADPTSNDGRSMWKWIRLPGGDLVLATYPRGETYELTELDRNRP